MSETKIVVEFPLCSREGCEVIAKSDGLCNTHYMAKYRAHTRLLEEEDAKVRSLHGDPGDYMCDGGDNETECSRESIRWFCKGGNIENAQALCQTHIDATIDSLRLDLRRLGAKK
jgi:hypothetical protein